MVARVVRMNLKNRVESLIKSVDWDGLVFITFLLVAVVLLSWRLFFSAPDNNLQAQCSFQTVKGVNVLSCVEKNNVVVNCTSTSNFLNVSGCMPT